jgi:sodium-dependent dicarboxylate transporter 2/3/5
MMKKLLNQNKKQLALITGIVLCLLCVIINPFSLDSKANLVLAVSILMISWWILEALPLAVVALIPIVLFPLLNISSIKEVTKSYSDSNIYLFMGGFFLGIAIEKWNLHKRIALSIINITGTNGNRIILGFILSTGFLSLWLSNTATTMMMFPIATSVINVVGQQDNTTGNMKNFSLVLMLSIAYASNFALGTIIGTPPNVAYVNYIGEKFNYNIGFAQWMVLFLPMTIILLFMLYWVMVKWLYPNHIKHSESGKSFIHSELEKLGKMSIPEKRVTAIFLFTVFCWIAKDGINNVQHWFVLDDTIIAMIGGLLMFVVPSGFVENEKATPILEWSDTKKMAWGILLLFGGGIAMAKSLEEAKLIDQLGAYLSGFGGNGIFLTILLVTTLSVFLSEVMSNVAQVIVMAPVVSAMAVSMHLDPLLLGIPMTLGASCASMLPMGTPPNAMVFASGHIRIQDMIKTGFVLNLISIILITVFCYFLQPMILKLG